MIRALIEFLLVVVLAVVARAVLTSVARGVSQASSSAFQQTAAEAERRRRSSGSAQETAAAGTLHKDPVCGIYVAESTPYSAVRRGERLYFCSASCQEQFAPLANAGARRG
jgi:YHS domain-containing protein